MNTPKIYSTQDAYNAFTTGTQARLPDGRWVPARPYGWQGLLLRHRLRCAWLVFTGRADVLQWEGQP